MEINEFAQKVRRAVERELGEKYRIELKKVQKNNGVMLHGLLILSAERNVVPTIYLETFHAAYEDGVTFGDVLDRILAIHREETPAGNIDMDFFGSFDRVRDRICYRLIRKQHNEELLRDIPYVDFLDLAICFYYAYSGRTLGEGTILIHDSHMEQWNVKVKDLMRHAAENTPRLFPGILMPMREVLEEMLEFHEECRTEEEIPLNVLTNSKRSHGASCILYPGLLERIAERNGKNFYIIPSSIHEVLILEETGAEEPAEMRDMIREVNREHVATEEVLSDNLYYYDLSSKSVKIIL